MEVRLYSLTAFCFFVVVSARYFVQHCIRIATFSLEEVAERMIVIEGIASGQTYALCFTFLHMFLGYLTQVTSVSIDFSVAFDFDETGL